jgi:hypothetical protein
VSPETSAAALELRTQAIVIVYFAIENDDVPAAFRAHWLVALLGKINDSEPSKRQRYSATSVDPNSVVIWAAMSDTVTHAQCYVMKLLFTRTSSREYSRQPAHGVSRLNGTIADSHRS